MLQRLYGVVKGCCCRTDGQQSRIAITGLGGLGKSELCVHLICKVKERYLTFFALPLDFLVPDQNPSFDNIFWVDVGNQQAAEQGFMNISDHLKLQAKSFQQVVQYLSGTRQTWLLVLDNADDPATDFHPFFPSGSRGTVIMTSRNPDCGQMYGYDHWEKLDVLESSSARDLLLRAARYEPSPANYEHANDIVKVLGSHTLAVVLAGSYIARHRNLDRYLDVYETHWNRIVQHAPRQERSRYGSVNATFEASVSILEGENSETSQDALQLLQILSTLAASNVPLSLFKEAWSGIGRTPEIDKVDDLDGVSDWHVSRLPEFIERDASEWDSYRLVEACNTLETLAIITSSSRGDSGKLSIHPLLHDWIWRRQTTQRMEVSWTMAGSAIALAFCSNREWSKHGNDYRSSLGSYITTRQKYRLLALPELPVLQIIYCCAASLHQVRSDRLALLCLEEIDGTDQLQPLAFRKLLAECRLYNGDMSRSITIWKEVVSREDRLAQNHPDRLASQHALAGAYLANGQIEQAIRLFEHVVEVSGADGVGDNADRLASQHNLASAYQADGQIKQAVNLLKHVVEAREVSLAENHPDRLASQHALAGAYLADYQVEKAVALLEHVVMVKRRCLAEDHPSRLASQHVLAYSYQENGQVEEAVALFKHVVRVGEASLGNSHPDQLTSQHGLACAYLANGQVEQAVALFEHVVSLWKKNVKESHPSKLASQHELACAYLADGQVEQAVALFEQVVSLWEGSVDESHPHRLTSQYELARAYQANGQVKPAVARLEHIVKVHEGSLAEKHPDYPTMLRTLAGAYQADGQVERSESLLRRLEVD